MSLSRCIQHLLVAIVAACFVTGRVAHAATTVVTSPTQLGADPNLYTIANGDEVIVQDGGSLTNAQITNNGRLEFAPTTGTMTNNAIFNFGSGSGSFIKSGAGTLVLSQPNPNYTGTWTLSGGTVRYGANTLGSSMFGDTTVNLAGGTIKPTVNDFTLDLPGLGPTPGNTTGGLVISSSGGTVDYSGLTGRNSITASDPTGSYVGVTGNGTWTYKAPGTVAVGQIANFATFDNQLNNYTGTTILSGGVFALNSNRGAVESYFGTSTVTFDGATLSSQFLGGATDINRTLQLYNNVVLGAGGGFTHGITTGSPQWIEFMQGISGSGAFTVTTANTRLSAVNSYTGDTRVGSLAPATLWLNNVDALAGSTLDWAAGDQGSITFQLAGNQTYNFGGLKGSRNLSLGTNSVAIGANNQSTTYSGQLSGSGSSVTKEGTGTFTLSGTNTYDGGTNLAGGTLALGSAGAVGTTGTLSFNGGTLQFSAANTTDYSGRFSNAASQLYQLDTNGQNVTIASNLTSTGGSLTKLGSGVLTVTGANTYSGGTTLAGGTLALGSAGAIGSAGTITFSGGTLQFSASNTTDASGRFSNAASQAYNLDTNGQNVSLTSALTSTGGTLTKIGTGTLTLGGANTYDGGTTVSAGTLKGSATSLQGAITNNARVEFEQGSAGTYAGVMSGSGDLVKTGSGALTLSGNNTYGGTTTVSAGTLLINGNQSSATGSVSVLSGATLGGSGTLGGQMSLASGSTLSPGNSPGTITAPSGTWAGGANYNVQIVDAAGTSGTDWDLANFTGSLDITATSGAPFNVNLWTLSSTGPDVNGSATNFSSNASYAWKIASAGSLTGFAANKFTVNTSATNGTAGFANSFGSGQFSVANAGNDINVVFTPAVVFDVTSGSQTQTQQGADANIATAVSVTKTGAGTVVMNGTNTYSAATSVNAGTMEVTGSISNSALTVNSGGTLAGTGTVAQLATVSSGGTLAPGSAAGGTGVLSLGSLALNSGATTVIKIADTGSTPGTDFDQVSILGSGALGLGGTLDLSTSNIDSAAAGTTYQLFNFTATPTGNFTSLTPLGGIYSGITWSGPTSGVWTSTAGTGGTYLTFTEGTGTLAVAVPEPATLALAGLAVLGGLLARRRRFACR